MEAACGNKAEAPPPRRLSREGPVRSNRLAHRASQPFQADLAQMRRGVATMSAVTVTPVPWYIRSDGSSSIALLVADACAFLLVGDPNGRDIRQHQRQHLCDAFGVKGASGAHAVSRRMPCSCWKTRSSACASMSWRRRDSEHTLAVCMRPRLPRQLACLSREAQWGCAVSCQGSRVRFNWST